MKHFQARMLAALGIGGMVSSILPACSGETQDINPGPASGGTAGTSGAGGSSAGSSSAGVSGSIGVGGTPSCGGVVTRCMPPEQAWNVAIPVSVSGAGGEGGAVSCPDAVNGPCGMGVALALQADASQCCYTESQCCGVGRPFVVDGRARVAPTCRRTDWYEQGGGLSCEARDPEVRAAAAREWSGDAQLEHASVASFGRLAMDLLSLGAPPELLADAHRAALDEVDHARRCFAIASNLSGEPLGPGPLDTSSTAAASDLISLAVASVHEGCVGETMAALIAAEQLNVAELSEIQETLGVIAEDETRHAELAYRVVRWAIDAGGMPVVRAVDAAFQSALAQLSASLVREATEAQSSEAELNRYGRLSARQTAAAKRGVIRGVIEPCARALAAKYGLVRGPSRLSVC